MTRYWTLLRDKYINSAQCYPFIHLIFLLSIAFIIFSSGLGLRDPWPPDEPRFALIAKEMVQSGHWFFPTRGGELYPDKPPLFMWCIALFYALLHNLRIAFLFPSLLAGLGTVWLTYDLAKRLWNQKTALIAGIVLLATLQFTLQAKTAQIDALLCLWITLGLYGLLRHLLLGPSWGWYSVSGIAVGLGVITKGVGFLPWFIFIPYIFCVSQRWQSIPNANVSHLRWLLSPLFALLVVSVWLVPLLWLTEYSQNPDFWEYRNNILFHQTLTRYAHAWHHVEPFWYYLAVVIPWAWFPVILLLPWIIPHWWKSLKIKDSRYVLLLGWMACVLLFFSLSPGKRGVYILPMAPVLALVVAPWIEKFWCRLYWRRLILGVLLLLSLFWLGLGWLVYYPINKVRSAEPLMQNVSLYMGSRGQLGLVAWKEQLLLHAPEHTKVFGFRSSADDQWRQAAVWLNQAPDRWVLMPSRVFYQNVAILCEKPTQRINLGRHYRQDWFLLQGCFPSSATQKIKN